MEHNVGLGKTGPIKCLRGFRARVLLIKTWGGEEDWFGAAIWLAGEGLGLEDSLQKLISLQNKEDPNTKLYGVAGSFNNIPSNLKRLLPQ